MPPMRAQAGMGTMKKTRKVDRGKRVPKNARVASTAPEAPTLPLLSPKERLTASEMMDETMPPPR